MNRTLECKLCGTLVYNCSTKSASVTCMYCVMEAVEPPPPTVKKSTGFPKGWKFMTTFVHQNGTVYHKGVEQPDLKDSLKPTEIKVVSKKDRLEKRQVREEALAQIGMLKNKLKKESKKSHAKKIQSQIKKLHKKL